MRQLQHTKYYNTIVSVPKEIELVSPPVLVYYTKPSSYVQCDQNTSFSFTIHTSEVSVKFLTGRMRVNTLIAGTKCALFKFQM